VKNISFFVGGLTRKGVYHMIEKIINGKTIHFTGQFELNPQYYAERLGATVVKSIAPDTKRLLGPVDFVVAGRSPSSVRLEQAQNLGIKVLDEKQFFDLVGRSDIWVEYDKVKSARMEEEKRRADEWEKRRVEAERAREIKRATMPHTRMTVDLLTCCGECETARLIEGEEYQSLTADQLREAISNGENDPRVVRDENGDFFLVCAEFRGQTSINFQPHEQEIELYDDGSFEIVEGGRGREPESSETV
jgi:hypothetical protein